MEEIKTLKALYIGLVTLEEIRIPAINIQNFLIEKVSTNHLMLQNSGKVHERAVTDSFHIALKSLRNCTSNYYMVDQETILEEDYIEDRLFMLGRDIATISFEYTDGSTYDVEVEWDLLTDDEDKIHPRQFASIDDESEEDIMYILGQVVKK